MLGGFAFKSSLLGLFTACDAVGALQVGGAQVKEDGKVSRGVARSKCQVRIVEFTAAM